MSQQENFKQSIISQPKKPKEACKVCGDQSYSSAFGVPACHACQVGPSGAGWGTKSEIFNWLERPSPDLHFSS